MMLPKQMKSVLRSPGPSALAQGRVRAAWDLSDPPWLHEMPAGPFPSITPCAGIWGNCPGQNPPPFLTLPSLF